MGYQNDPENPARDFQHQNGFGATNNLATNFFKAAGVALAYANPVAGMANVSQKIGFDPGTPAPVL